MTKAQALFVLRARFHFRKGTGSLAREWFKQGWAVPVELPTDVTDSHMGAWLLLKASEIAGRRLPDMAYQGCLRTLASDKATRTSFPAERAGTQTAPSQPVSPEAASFDIDDPSEYS